MLASSSRKAALPVLLEAPGNLSSCLFGVPGGDIATEYLPVQQPQFIGLHMSEPIEVGVTPKPVANDM
jgi:hypothetical protein